MNKKKEIGKNLILRFSYLDLLITDFHYKAFNCSFRV